jgi:hypothetical protein
MTTIYRGFDITPVAGGFTIHSGGSYPVVTDVFASEEAAMNHIDALRKAANLAKET